MKEAKDTNFNPTIPIVTHISGYRLQVKGWQKENGVYKKDDDELIYDGMKWIYNGTQVQFMEDLKK